MVRLSFAIYDEKAEAYLQPFFLNTVGMALRAVTDIVNNPEHEFARHAADYTLFQLAEYDDCSGEFINCKKPLGSLIEFKTQTEMFDDKQLNLLGGSD